MDHSVIGFVGTVTPEVMTHGNPLIIYQRMQCIAITVGWG
jgi:hypothetical protein